MLRVSGARIAGAGEPGGVREAYAPEPTDPQTMGSSLLIQLREVDTHEPFIPPTWAYKYHDGDLPNRDLMPEGNNFWWIEIGGTGDTIAQTEKYTATSCSRCAYGVWDYIKNHPDGAAIWELEWIRQPAGQARARATSVTTS